jgi:hypothetical protein
VVASSPVPYGTLDRYGRHMGQLTGPVVLRRGVLAVSVLDDVALVPDTDGIRLGEPDAATTLVSWDELAMAVGDHDPESQIGRRRLRDWLRLRALFAELGPAASWRAEQTALPLGLPVDHVLHPGPDWSEERVLGGAIDLGIGLRGLIGDDPDEVTVLPRALAAALGLDTRAWWPSLRARLESMAELAVARLKRDANGVITPMGGCDVVTLMGALNLRAYLALSDGTGMRAVAVPMRSRGWFDLARIDPAFVGAAASATDEIDRGFWRPLLVTCEEVAIAAEGGDVTTHVLLDPAALEPKAWSAPLI